MLEDKKTFWIGAGIALLSALAAIGSAFFAWQAIDQAGDVARLSNLTELGHVLEELESISATPSNDAEAQRFTNRRVVLLSVAELLVSKSDDSLDSALYGVLAKAHSDVGNTVRAMEYYRRAINVGGDPWLISSAHRSLAQLFAFDPSLGDTEAARSEFAAGISILGERRDYAASSLRCNILYQWREFELWIGNNANVMANLMLSIEESGCQ